MTERYFYNADGEMLIVPQQGRARFVTELGVLEVADGEIAIIPRGLRLRVELPDGPSRGYICENYGQMLRLPELGPLGSRRSRPPRLNNRSNSMGFADRWVLASKPGDIRLSKRHRVLSLLTVVDTKLSPYFSFPRSDKPSCGSSQWHARAAHRHLFAARLFHDCGGKATDCCPACGWSYSSES
jgi:hypothetical protein